MPSTSGSLAITIELKAEYWIRPAAMLWPQQKLLIFLSWHQITGRYIN